MYTYEEVREALLCSVTYSTRFMEIVGEWAENSDRPEEEVKAELDTIYGFLKSQVSEKARQLMTELENDETLACSPMVRKGFELICGAM